MPGTFPSLAASMTDTPASTSTECLEPSNSTKVILGIYSALTILIHTIAARRILAAHTAVPAFSSRAIYHSLHLVRSEEHTSELQSLMRTSYAVFCLTKKIK